MAFNGDNLADKNQVVVVLIPFPAQGHLNQLMHLSHLISSHNIPVHYVSTVTHIRQATLRHHKSIISNIHFHGFEVPPFVSPPPNPNNPETDFPTHLIPSLEASMHLREPVRKLLQSLSFQAKRVIVIHDSPMASVAQDATNMPNVENYTFHCTCAFSVYVSFWDKMGRPSVEAMHALKIPSLEGCFPTQFLDFLIAKRDFLKLSDGIVYNTSRVIDADYIDLMEVIPGGKKVWALGPFNPLAVEKKGSKERHSCMEWLDKQEPNSVIYVSFGTTTPLKVEQIEQVATGLEQSKQKFIWVLRDADKGDIFDENEAKRLELPNGFEERVKDMGLVVRDWAPQLEILSHSSTGGFMSHCGWNSCLESISMGVPIATWPFHSDQPRNAALITEVLKVGLVVKDWSQRNSLVSGSVVEDAVRRLMQTEEGDEMRERAGRLKNAIHKSTEEGGVSHTEMDSFIAHITK
uniref:Glycosyltransferase n=1 Tax=Phaseolus lunatus TaxID=3884 RepID=Q8S3B5_PHALU|nr:putative glucosyltransferase [Phaseolus lunatus]